MKSKTVISIISLFFLLTEFAFAHGQRGFFLVQLFNFIILSSLTLIEILVYNRITKRKKITFMEIGGVPAALLGSFLIFSSILSLFRLYNVFPFLTSLFLLILIYFIKFLFIYYGIKKSTIIVYKKKLIVISSISFVIYILIMYILLPAISKI
jgi:hypothetical protein